MAHLESGVSCLQNKNQQRREDVVPSGAAGLYGYCEDGYFYTLPQSLRDSPLTEGAFYAGAAGEQSLPL